MSKHMESASEVEGELRTQMALAVVRGRNAKRALIYLDCGTKSVSSTNGHTKATARAEIQRMNGEAWAYAQALGMLVSLNNPGTDALVAAEQELARAKSEAGATPAAYEAIEAQAKHQLRNYAPQRGA